MYVRFPLSLRNVEELLHERGIDICHEAVTAMAVAFGRSLREDPREDSLSLACGGS